MNRRLIWALLAICGLAAFIPFAYPMYVIRPFRAQGADELAAALAIRRWGPSVAIAAAAFAIVVCVLQWRRSRRIRVGVTLTSALTVAFAALSHVNVYEMMFHRIDSPDAMAASEAKLDDDDMVLSINAGGHARAYPVRMMAYHHIVNDRLGSVPVAATY